MKLLSKMKLVIFIKDLGLTNGTNDIDIIDAYNKEAQNIMNEIEGYQTISHTSGTNVIFVDAKWKGKHISTNIEKIKKNESVLNYHIIHDLIGELEGAVNYHDILKRILWDAHFLNHIE